MAHPSTARLGGQPGLRVAVIGVGHLGKFHTRILSSMPGVDLIGVVDSDQATAEQVAREYSTRAYTDYRQILGQVDAAVLAVPTRLHRALGEPLLQAGVHLLIEKPLAGTLSEAQSLQKTASAHGRVLAVGHVERFNPAWVEATAFCRQPKYITASRLCTHTFRSTDIGAVLDLMIHDLDLILALVDQPVVQVQALGVTIFGGEEDVVNARLVFEGGCLADLTASRASFVTARHMQLFTADGYAQVDFGQKTTTFVELSPVLRQSGFHPEELLASQRAEIRDQLFENILPKRSVTPAGEDQLTAELTDFLAAVRDGTAPKTSAADALRGIEVAERILEQVAEHCWDGDPNGRRGPRAFLETPTSAALQGPHWSRIRMVKSELESLDAEKDLHRDSGSP